MEAMTASRGAVARRHRRADPRRLPLPRRARGRVLRAGVSAASVAGLLAHGADGAERVVCVLTGHGLKDPQTALDQAGAVVPCEPDLAAVEKRRARLMNRRRLVRVPASSANLGPGFDVLARGARPAPRAGGGRDRPLRGRDRPRDRRRPPQPRRARRSSALHPADDFEFTIRSDIPLSGGLGTSAAAIVAGLLAADSIFELGADVLGRGDAARGPSRQRRGGAARRVRHLLPTARVERFEPPPALEALLVVPRAVRCARPRRAPRCRRGADRRRRLQRRARRRCWCSGSRAATSDLVAPRARRPPAPAAPRAPVPALVGAGPARARARRARRDDLRRRPDRARVVRLRVRPARSPRGCAARCRTGPRCCACRSPAPAPSSPEGSMS